MIQLIEWLACLLTRVHKKVKALLLEAMELASLVDDCRDVKWDPIAAQVTEWATFRLLASLIDSACLLPYPPFLPFFFQAIARLLCSRHSKTESSELEYNKVMQTLQQATPNPTARTHGLAC